MKHFIIRKDNCKICGELVDSKHLKTHGLDFEQYLKKYIKEENDEKCLKCGEEVKITKSAIFENGVQYNRYGYTFFCDKCRYGVTLEKMILKYGEEIGTKKFEEYKRKQAETNSLEYKKEKYGWTEEQFKEYNASRSVTLENLIKRHGEEIGRKKFADYVEKQRDAGCSLSYFIGKYGEEEGSKKYKELNNKKRLCLENYVRKYGEEEGSKKYAEYMKINTRSFWSKISIELFEKISIELPGKYRYATKDGEIGLMDEENNMYYFYDFTDVEKKLIIEFHGDAFHAKSIDQEDFKNPFQPNLTAKEKYLYDQRRIKFAEENGYKTLVIWESEYKSDKEGVLKKCLEFLNEG